MISAVFSVATALLCRRAPCSARNNQFVGWPSADREEIIVRAESVSHTARVASSFATASLLIASGIAALPTATEAAAQILDDSAAAQIVDQAIQACNERRIEPYVRAYNPGAVVTLIFEDTAAAWLRGAEQIRQFGESSCGQIKIEVLDRFLSHNRVFQREQWRQADGNGGHGFRWTFAQVYLVEHGSILRQWRYPEESDDPAYVPTVRDPRYELGRGPVVYIDRAHQNGHTMDGSYWPLAELLRRDGYMVQSWSESFSDSLPPLSSVLVIANPDVMITREEVARLREWVAGGGGLLVITDHAPGPNRIGLLADAFRIEIRSGFVIDTIQAAAVFRRRDGSVVEHRITDGLEFGARVDSVVTHTGSAFTAPEDAWPLLRFPATMVFFESRRMDGPGEPVEGLLQAAALEPGDGRVVLFSEAGLFRVLTPAASGVPVVGQNALLARNVVFWLAER